MRGERKEKIKYILNILMGMGAIAIASQSPYFVSRLIKLFFKCSKWDIKELAKCFWGLKYEGYISVRRKNNRFEIKLTIKGKERLKYLNYWDLKLEKEKRWDKKWRIIIFDVPQKMNKIREMFRLKLREFGFYQLQKSVWIYPYKCEKEIAYLRELLGGGEYIKMIIAKDIELDDKVFNFFHLQPSKTPEIKNQY